MQDWPLEIAPRGLATSFTETEVPPDYALKFRNRFINQIGSAEKRQGLAQYGGNAGTATITGVHELISKTGASTRFATGDGVVWRLTGSAWSSVYSGFSTVAIVRSVQFNDRLIFYNGVDPAVYTSDGTNFYRLNAVHEKGESTTGTNQERLLDTDVTNWLTTRISTNDLLWNRTRSAYAIITAIATATVVHTTIGSAATGLGQASVNQVVGDFYQIIDLVANNVIPTAALENDNVAVGIAGTNATTIVVSGVNFLTSDVRAGDIVNNTTRSAIVMVSAVATALTVTSCAGQTSGDSFTFFKNASPIPTKVHVHYDRAYMVDEREQYLIRITSPNDIEDFGTNAGTLDSFTLSYGRQQPKGNIVRTLESFQRFLVIGGSQDVALFEGTDPIATTASSVTDFRPVGLFPHGVVSPYAMISIGNDVVFASPDGLQSIALVDDASTLNRVNLSEPLRNTLRTEIANTDPDQIQLFHYPRRSWIGFKIGANVYVYSYTPFSGSEAGGQRYRRAVGPGGSWSVFDGLFGQMRAFKVMQDGTLVCGGSNGIVYRFDRGTYSDAGDPISTEYQTGFLALEKRKSPRVKSIKYIRPIFNSGYEAGYTIRAEGGYEAEATETITVTATGALNRPVGIAVVGTDTIGGVGVSNVKHGLRARGEVVRVTFENNTTNGPDIISRYTLYGNVEGHR